ncbi:glycoside hydrolase family 43 protein [Rubrivirga marina]|uniref:Beta-xylosidase C-terminal Concanavalin A-like domain-containing protein n=1 Tax=Rubrivirga marina TaxID=1196024 RepID=A0A271IUY8_9BACT|nr:glycoside hydrolase family 43 protein [Rubrivirga marina]PAP75023.1 hypothetical protein BSZ37_00425 [Rubrivirga marina]
MTTPRGLWAALFALALTVPACVSADASRSTAASPVVADGTARFESFTYTGDDAVYKERVPGPGQFTNPVLAGYYPDPSIEQVGDDYYLVNSSFAHTPGIPIWHSRDLVNWTQIGHALTRPAQTPFEDIGISRGIFAPTIRYHDGTYYIITTWIDSGGNAIITAEDPAGPWSDPIWLDFGGIDPDFFVDDDGRAYVVNNDAPIGEPLYSGHRALWIQELDLETMAMVGPRELIVNGGVDITEQPVWIEGPHIYKKDGMYYLVCAEGGTSVNHSVVVFRAETVWGPWEPWDQNPILTQRHLDDEARDFPITSVGHADFVQTPGGDWWAVFLGTRPYRGNEYNTNRETFLLPVDWPEGGWPMIIDPDTRAEVPYIVDRPDLPEGDAPYPTSGNFTITDDFEDGLDIYWTSLRSSSYDWRRLDDGALVLDAQPVGLWEMGVSSFVGRRQQHLTMSAETTVSFDPQTASERAGLAAFQQDEAHLLLSVGLRGGERVVEVERRFQGEATTLASAALPGVGPVRLRVEADGPDYAFSYAVADGGWQPLAADVDGSILSTQRAGGFVGVLLGMYASSAHPAPPLP